MHKPSVMHILNGKMLINASLKNNNDEKISVTVAITQNFVSGIPA